MENIRGSNRDDDDSNLYRFTSIRMRLHGKYRASTVGYNLTSSQLVCAIYITSNWYNTVDISAICRATDIRNKFTYIIMQRNEISGAVGPSCELIVLWIGWTATYFMQGEWNRYGPLPRETLTKPRENSLIIIRLRFYCYSQRAINGEIRRRYRLATCW